MNHPVNEEGVTIVREVDTTKGNKLEGGEEKEAGGSVGEGVGEENPSTRPEE